MQMTEGRGGDCQVVPIIVVIVITVARPATPPAHGTPRRALYVIAHERLTTIVQLAVIIFTLKQRLPVYSVLVILYIFLFFPLTIMHESISLTC